MSVRPDGIHRRGRAAVLAGQELLDVPPGPGSTRWGLSLDVRLDLAAEQHLDALAAEASMHTGPGQWLTGAHGSSHLTVTYLERVWREVDEDDAEVRRFASLVTPLAARAPALRWRLVGAAAWQLLVLWLTAVAWTALRRGAPSWLSPATWLLAPLLELMMSTAFSSRFPHTSVPTCMQAGECQRRCSAPLA